MSDKTRLDTYFEKSEIGNYGTRKLRKLYAATFPFIGEFFAGADCLETLIDPLAGISGTFVGGDEAVSDQLRIQGFLETFPANLSQPQLEGFGFL